MRLEYDRRRQIVMNDLLLGLIDAEAEEDNVVVDLGLQV
jgi:hypothetical protein